MVQSSTEKESGTCCLVDDTDTVDHRSDGALVNGRQFTGKVHVLTDVLDSLVRTGDGRGLTRQDDFSPLLCDTHHVVEVTSEDLRTKRLVSREDRHSLSALVVLSEFEPAVCDERDVTGIGLTGNEALFGVALAGSRVGEHLEQCGLVVGGGFDHCNL